MDADQLRPVDRAGTERSRTKRPEQLDRLVETARAELRRWAQSQSHDPGIALLEAVAILGDTLSFYAERVAQESYLGTRIPESSVHLAIDGQPWLGVASLDESGPDDRHYVVSVREDGATVIEFGDGEHGRQPPVGGRLRLSFRRRLRLGSVEMERGRVVLDPDWNGPTTQEACGIHRALVVSGTDPSGQGRLLVQIPGLTGVESRWAVPSFPPGTRAALPPAGETVWVYFEACELDHPVWVGRPSP